MTQQLAVLALVLAGAASTCACVPRAETPKPDTTAGSYLDFRTPGEPQTGGVRMIPLKEGFRVWTKQFGTSPMKVLLLHGGPAATHEYMEAFESFFPRAGIEFFEYDQLGAAYSDQPDDESLWNVDRFVEEVEQVRTALGLEQDDFYLLGHSWGGILAMEYALKHQDHLKGLIIADMTADFGRYAAYNAKLRAGLPKDVLDQLAEYESRGAYHDPKYEELVFSQYYSKHILRMPEWPDPVERAFKHLNQKVYEYMQGPSEFVPGGILKGWSAWDRLDQIRVPTLTVGATYDTMDPADMEEMSKRVQHGRFLLCPNGSHMSMWDDQEVFMKGVIQFIEDVQGGKFP
jgi:proline iminopeptidase